MNTSMKLISWSQTFACGIKLVDEQHKGLIDLVNEMYSHVTGNEEQERKYFDKVIHKAVEYIKVHFAAEEKILRTTNFLGYIEHKKAHDNFILVVAQAISNFSSGKHISLYTFTKFLKTWILSHIAVMDKQYFAYLKKIASRKTDGKLSITWMDIQSASMSLKTNLTPVRQVQTVTQE